MVVTGGSIRQHWQVEDNADGIADLGLKAAAPAAHIQHEKLGNPHRKPYPCVMKIKMTNTVLRSLVPLGETAAIARLKTEPSTSIGVGNTLRQRGWFIFFNPFIF